MSDFPDQPETSARRSDIETLYALASLATTASDTRVAQSSILAAIVAAFPADSGSLSLLSPESGRLEISAQMGLPPETGDFALRPGQGITGWVALHGRPLLAADVSHEPRYIAARPGVCCEMAAPLFIDGRIIGVDVDDADDATIDEQGRGHLAADAF